MIVLFMLSWGIEVGIETTEQCFLKEWIGHSRKKTTLALGQNPPLTSLQVRGGFRMQEQSTCGTLGQRI